MTRRIVLATVVAVALAAGCAGGPPADDDGQDTPRQSIATDADAGNQAATTSTTGAKTLLAVADIGNCESQADEKVAAMLARRRGRIALAGDIAYPDGSRRDFRRCFDPAWGPLRSRLRPTPGNHEYHTPHAAAYFEYFGDVAGRPGRGWYAFNAGPYWRVIMLNSNCAHVGGCSRRSPQGRWLARALQRASGRHVLAVFHVPRFSSGKHGSSTTVAPLWRQLYRARAEIVVNGHDHSYERFARQNPRGERTRDGIRQFTVGTGGRHLYPFGGPPLATTQRRDNTTHGFLRLRLRADGYSWRFVPVTSDGFTDRGSTSLPPP